VRFAPRTVEGVVTYETVLAVDNTDLALRPGMTATAVITVQELQDALLVPNAALRFTPPVTEAAQPRQRGAFGMIFPRPPMGQRRSNADKNDGQKVWVLRDAEPEAVPVKTGASDGMFTELQSGELHPGVQVVVDTVTVKP
jgi:HlyD family secretion protein